LYGDLNNKFATFAFWVFKYYRYNDVRLLDGGRKKWIQEGREISSIVPTYSKGSFVAMDEPDKSNRALYHFVKDNLWGTSNKTIKFVDARSEEEYNGKILSPPEYPLENPQRAGHIPGAINIPWD
jgi:thiosulfate/3-mercaptopyruvate sulfurtransferase